MPRELTIRPARPSDAAALASLAGELGYPATAGQMAERLRFASADQVHGVFVAEADTITGWIHVTEVLSLESDPHAEIRGLVVAGTMRGKGVGSLLVRKAEAWAGERGLRRIRVRTNVVREETRAYYRRRGFAAVKTQEVLDKELGGAGR